MQAVLTEVTASGNGLQNGKLGSYSGTQAQLHPHPHSYHGNFEAHSWLPQEVRLGYPAVLKYQVGSGRGSDSQFVFFLPQ